MGDILVGIIGGFTVVISIAFIVAMWALWRSLK